MEKRRSSRNIPVSRFYTCERLHCQDGRDYRQLRKLDRIIAANGETDNDPILPLPSLRRAKRTRCGRRANGLHLLRSESDHPRVHAENCAESGEAACDSCARPGSGNGSGRVIASGAARCHESVEYVRMVDVDPPRVACVSRHCLDRDMRLCCVERSSIHFEPIKIEMMLVPISQPAQ